MQNNNISFQQVFKHNTVRWGAVWYISGHLGVLDGTRRIQKSQWGDSQDQKQTFWSPCHKSMQVFNNLAFITPEFTTELVNGLQVWMNEDILQSHSCFHFEMCQNCSVITTRLWNNNIQVHSVISQQCWQRPSWQHNIGTLTPGGKNEVCFMNEHIQGQRSSASFLVLLTQRNFIFGT